MTLNDLLADVLDELPDDRRKAVEAMTEKFGASDTFRFTLALLAATDSRERRLSRLLLNEIDRLDIG
jgi:anti-sigma factor RsiW